MKILDQGIVYDAASAPVHRRFCAFTNVTALSDGRILVAFHAGSAKEAPDENVLMRLSVDGQREFADYYADMRVRSFGHVEPALLPDGSVFVALYAGDAQSLSIRWAHIQL